jgi:hypothetical protein
MSPHFGTSDEEETSGVLEEDGSLLELETSEDDEEATLLLLSEEDEETAVSELEELGSSSSGNFRVGWSEQAKKMVIANPRIASAILAVFFAHKW